MKRVVALIFTILFLILICAPASSQNRENSRELVAQELHTALIETPHCPDNMVEIDGDYCPNVQEICLKWLDTTQMRCAEFKQPSTCLSKERKHLHFCMSKFEYPGTEGSYPLVGMDYYEAKEIAEKDGNRLCTKEEFNFACEGEDIHPYGYGDGFHRDSNICNIDKPWIDYGKFDQSSWNDPGGGLYQAVRSESVSLCKSDFGIYNLNGNVDEILDSEHSKNVVLSGGYWSTVRSRCRPTTDAHNKYFSFYQIGFRECK
jgi:formylglycine-generating enzyme required for sulfatase activity